MTSSKKTRPEKVVSIYTVFNPERRNGNSGMNVFWREFWGN